ncbi:AbrB/MazE/SpoVT family DNA-binding domain-containing protein [Bacillus thuringiensis]|uniref:AbrB/MazE/SpoVT family DNA-binding domain-containing protein n=1 Tax=Bacillus thuringiensis TaxID=1428 RepID=UPI0019D2F7F3|nr:AbrB/MazE/SpoVT family DNA-binding domain-containing protein [Bacillus thuringiensis]
MKATGITRKVDELGRIVIPKELRRTLNIDIKDPIEIFTEEDSIILRKYESNMACMITGEVSNKNISLFNGKIIVSPEGAELLIKRVA